MAREYAATPAAFTGGQGALVRALGYHSPLHAPDTIHDSKHDRLCRRRAGHPVGTLGCELRSVNHRFLEVGTRLPEELRALEPQLRERIAARLSRGKLDLVVRLRAPEAAANLQVDEALLGQLGRLAHRLTSDFPNLQVSFTDLLQLPGVTRGEATDAAALQVEALALLDQVLDGFVEAREREGGKLSAAISERVDGIERIATEVRTLIPAIRDGQRAKLAARLADLPHPVDPPRRAGTGAVAAEAGRGRRAGPSWQPHRRDPPRAQAA